MRYTMEASIKEPNVLQTYEELKSDFEKCACRIDDVLLYPVLDTIEHRRRDTRGSQIQFSILRTFVKRLLLFWMLP